MFRNWPIIKTFIALGVAGLIYQMAPSRLGNERLADDIALIGTHLISGETDAAYAAIQKGFAPFLPAPRPTGQATASSTERGQRPSGSRREVRISAQADNHFYVSPRVNGRKTEFVIDTGATFVAIRHEDALKMGLKVAPADFTSTVRTANGTTRFAPVMIDRIELEGIVVRNVRGAVAPRGALSVNLLGMSFLKELSDVRFNGNEILLVE